MNQEWPLPPGADYLPMAVIRPLIYGRQPLDELAYGPRVGQVEMFTEVLDGPPTRPRGWLECDGHREWRSEWQELAPLCRRFTGWFVWHVLRQFRTPDRREDFVIGVDPGVPLRRVK